MTPSVETLGYNRVVLPGRREACTGDDSLYAGAPSLNDCTSREPFRLPPLLQIDNDFATGVGSQKKSATFICAARNLGYSPRSAEEYRFPEDWDLTFLQETAHSRLDFQKRIVWTIFGISRLSRTLTTARPPWWIVY
jgi:hypothetical protein